jgi:DNA-binding beta-propeller fold protein YncE
LPRGKPWADWDKEIDMPLVPTVNPEAMPAPQAKETRRGGKRWIAFALLLLLLLCTFCVWGYYLTTRQSLTKALPAAKAVTRAVKPHYLFSIYGMQEPVGVAITPDGERIYVAESGGDRLIRAYDREGTELFSFAPPKSQPATRAPVYITLDAEGQVYVSDRIRHSVDVYNAGGNFLRSLKSPVPEVWSPMGLRFDDTDLYLTDVTKGKHRVLALNKDNGLVEHFGREGRGGNADELSFPNSLVVDPRGRIYISDSNNARIQVFNKGGNYLYTIAGFSLPRGLALDADQRLYVVDAVSHIVKVFDVTKDSAELLFTFGDMGIDDGLFNYPNDITLDITDRLYIADRVNNRVQVWVY